MLSMANISNNEAQIALNTVSGSLFQREDKLSVCTKYQYYIMQSYSSN